MCGFLAKQKSLHIKRWYNKVKQRSNKNSSTCVYLGIHLPVHQLFADRVKLKVNKCGSSKIEDSWEWLTLKSF